MKYSIIIPTYNKCDELLKPCIESILKYTDLFEVDAEIIIVENGCTDNTHDYVNELINNDIAMGRVTAMAYPEAIGFTKAVNRGMEKAQGEYFIILNNDTILLEQPKNQWLEVLNHPFKYNHMPEPGITGPMKVPNDATGLPFLIFFCVMVSRRCYDNIGPMDEIFSPGYGEDTDWCLRAESRGFACVQVPEESSNYYAEKRMVGNFPIYHVGNQTFKDHPDAELIHRNNAIIKERWGKTIGDKRVEPYLNNPVHSNMFDEMVLSDKIVKANDEIVKHFLEDQYLDESFASLVNDQLKKSYLPGTGLPVALITGYEISKIPIDISRAKLCDGYMADSELEWLATQAKGRRLIIEIGSWHGKSSRALVDNLPFGGALWCVDHWKGSETERGNNHASAYGEDGDAAYLEFLENMWDVTGTKMHSIRLSSKNAAKYLSNHVTNKADMIFIDAGHTYEEVKADILAWLPLLKEGGIMCGHDAYHMNNPFPGVLQAVTEIFGSNVEQAPNTSIWVIKKTLAQAKADAIVHMFDSITPKPKRPPCVYDCFPYNNEVDVLLERFETLYDAVDRFIIVEARVTHGGKPKELTFEKNLDKFAKYINKVTYLVIDAFPEVEGSPTDKSWARERFQRDFIMNGITDCQDDDIIIISDCDEIPSVDAIKRYHRYSTEKPTTSEVGSFEMDLYYYNKHTRATDKWREAKIACYSRVKELSPCGIRYLPITDPSSWLIRNGGNHYSYFGGVETIAQKIEDTAHQEYNTDHYKDRRRILNAMRQGTDVFDRPDVKFTRV